VSTFYEISLCVAILSLLPYIEEDGCSKSLPLYLRPRSLIHAKVWSSNRPTFLRTRTNAKDTNTTTTYQNGEKIALVEE